MDSKSHLRLGVIAFAGLAVVCIGGNAGAIPGPDHEKDNLAAGKPAEARTTYRRAQVFNVQSLVVTAGDRAIIERLEAHMRQTVSSGG